MAARLEGWGGGACPHGSRRHATARLLSMRTLRMLLSRRGRRLALRWLRGSPRKGGMARVQYLPFSWRALSLPLLAAPAAAQTSYTAPAEFMNLFFDFTGSSEPGYPVGEPTLGQMLTQAVIAREGGARGPLVLVVGSDIYVYASSGAARLAHARFPAA